MPPETFSMATYNSQGAKWSEVEVLSRTNFIVAVQETGADPALQMTHQADYRVNGFRVRHYLWRTSQGQRHVYYLNPFSDRQMNLAIVTVQPADRVLVAPGLGRNEPGESARPALGVLFGSHAIFSVHALSTRTGTGGRDVPVLLNSIRQEAGIVHANWYAMGDFNREPESLDSVARDMHASIYRSGNPTHQSGHELDYMVASRDIRNYRAERLPGRGSDHYPVQFQLRNTTDSFALTSLSNGGRVVDVDAGSDANGAHVITYDDWHGKNQSWRTRTTGDTFTLRNAKSGKCIDASGGPGAGSGNYLNQWDCQNQQTQVWRAQIDPVEKGVVTLVNVYTGLCMDVLGNGTANGSWLGLFKCTGAQNQKFLFSPR
ncbi:RICIN domain-containing protein [Streptomyces sp. NPDC097981]|uniref:RICIN domain-containing protein n=1 Tax=Streptomyces sp. NPDC097981 TaxID=3155428 RepID=UPI00331E9ABD